MQVRWLRKALKNLEQAYSYSAQSDPATAVQLVLKIQATAEKLTTFPKMGRVGRVEGTRELIIAGTPYILIYRVYRANRNRPANSALGQAISRLAPLTF